MYFNIFTNNEGKDFKRVRKDVAKKYYLLGKDVVICPCNAKPFLPYHMEFTFNKEILDNSDMKGDFDKYIDYYTFYNCGYKEIGKYPAFYLEV